MLPLICQDYPIEVQLDRRLVIFINFNMESDKFYFTNFQVSKKCHPVHSDKRSCSVILNTCIYHLNGFSDIKLRKMSELGEISALSPLLLLEKGFMQLIILD